MKAVDPVKPDEPLECLATEPGGPGDQEITELEEEYEEDEEETSWIEIKLVDAAGQPAPGARYKIKLSNGKFVRGVLDENGFGRHENLPPGPHQFCFTELDAGAWE